MLIDAFPKLKSLFYNSFINRAFLCRARFSARPDLLRCVLTLLFSPRPVPYNTRRISQIEEQRVCKAAAPVFGIARAYGGHCVHYADLVVFRVGSSRVLLLCGVHGARGVFRRRRNGRSSRRGVRLHVHFLRIPRRKIPCHRRVRRDGADHAKQTEGVIHAERTPIDHIAQRKVKKTDDKRAVGIILTQSRGSILFGGSVFLVALVLSLVKAPKRGAHAHIESTQPTLL